MIFSPEHFARTSATYAAVRDQRTAAGPSPAEAFQTVSQMNTNGSLDDHQAPNRYASFEEMKRIVQMPAVRRMEEAEAEEYSRLNILAEAYDSGFRLLPDQVEAVSQYELYAGAFCDIPVGEGKTLASLMIANKAFQKGISKIVLLVPPSVLSQLISTSIRWARCRVPINLPIHVVGGQPRTVRQAISKSGKKGLYVITYSCMSTADSSENLNAIAPGLIIADEAHNLARSTSTARARRVMKYVDDSGCELVVLSGTITAKTIRDYYHLIKAALKGNNPLPNSTHLANEWAAVIDADGAEGDSPSTSGPLMPLVDWAEKKFGHEEHFGRSVAGFRKAYRFRRNTAPGVVTGKGDSVKCSLILKNHPLPDYKQAEGWNQLDELMVKVTDQWLTPNGDQIDHAIHTWKWLNELTAGFYNELTWPTAAAYAARKRISESEAGTIISKAILHHEQGQIYHKMLRDFLLDHPPDGLDTPHLVGQDMARHKDENVPPEMFEEWCLWKALDFEGRPERDSRAVRVCPYKIDFAVQWAKDHTDVGGIIWYYHQEIGDWLHEAITKAGIDSVHCPAGDRFNDIIRTLGDPDSNGKGDRIVVAAYGAHGEGKNLQAFRHCLFAQWPRDSKKSEQTLGRLHRQGQLADELTQETVCVTLFDELNFAACLNDTLYQQQTTGAKKKLIYASYDPLPRIFPSSVLIERGLQAQRLTPQQQKELIEKFGKEAA